MSLIATAYAATEEGIKVSLSPYIVGDIFGVPITATLLTVWLGMVILIGIALYARRSLTLIPNRVQSVFELMIGGVYDYMADVLESRTLARTYFPIVMTIFLFILTLNWLGLFPGVTAIGFYEGHGTSSHFVPYLYPAATDLNITFAFALVAFMTIQVAGVSAIGVFKYAGKFLNFSSPLGFAVGLIELVSEIARLISFSFRLFGNILAGKTLLLVITMFVPYIVPVPMLAFEVFVGFIQAFVFAILTLFFIKIAVEEPAH
jgi:F-type H+-transporting ATPase subunit a